MQKKYPRQAVLSRSKISRRLQLISARNTKVIELRFQDNNPLYATDLLKSMLAGYDAALKQIAQDTRLKSVTFLKERLLTVQQHRHELESNLATLQAESGTTDVDMKNEHLLRVNTSYSEALGELNARIIAAESDIQHLQKTLGWSPEEIRLFAQIKDDLQIRTWQESLGKEQAALSVLRSTYTDKYGPVNEKKQTVQQLENLITARIKTLYKSTSSQAGQVAYSSIDEALGKQLLDQHVAYLGMIGQRAYYDGLLASLSPAFSSLADQKRQITNLQFQLDTLKAEEAKLTDKIQDGNIQDDMMSHMETFTVLTPPVQPKPHQYIFPLQPKDTVVGGFLASVLLALFVVSLVEYFDPRVVALDSLPILAEIGKTGTPQADIHLKQAFQHLALLINKLDCKTLTLCHLFEDTAGNTHMTGDNDRHFDRPVATQTAMTYSPSRFGESLAAMFAQRAVKTILVDCTNDTSPPDETVEEPLSRILDYTLYRRKDNPNLHILRPTRSGNTFFDPYILKLIPSYGQYQLTMLNSSMSSQDGGMDVLCEVSEATVLGISQSLTSSLSLRGIQHLAAEHRIKVLGSFLFP
jgi:uncharacterized protein involved in exopolysaccharide biosynthesis